MTRPLKLVEYGLFLALCGLLLFPLLASAFSGTSITFQSSDGLWGDNEIQFKGRKFRTIVVLFELYKIKCNVPEVILQRVTRRPEGFSIEGLFNDYSDPKWMVPLSENSEPKKVGYFEPKCATRGVFDSEARLATERADRYIELLKSQESATERKP